MHHPSITAQNAHQLAPIARFPVGWITEVAWSPKGSILAVANAEGLSLFKFQGKQVVHQRLTGSTEPLRTCHFAPDGEWIATGGDDGIVRLWNIAPDQPNQCIVLPTGGEVQKVRFNPNGKWMAVAVKNDIKLFATSGDFSVIRTLSGHEGDVTALAMSQNGKWLASAGWDQSIRLWNPNSGTCQTVFSGHTQRINHLEFPPQSDLLVSAARDGTFRLWSVSEYKELSEINGHAGKAVDALAFSQNGSLLVSGGRDHIARIWDTTNWQAVATLNAHTKPIISVAFRPDDALLATASGDNSVLIWAV